MLKGLLRLMSTMTTMKFEEQVSMTVKGSHPLRKVQFFFNIVQKAFDPPPPSFEHHAEFAVSAGSENLI